MRSAILERQSGQVNTYQGSREVKFSTSDRVMVRDYSNPNKSTWKPGVVVKRLGARNYLVKLASSGREIKRHVNQMIADTRKAEPDREVCTAETRERRSCMLNPENYRAPVMRSMTEESVHPRVEVQAVPPNSIMEEPIEEDEESFLDPPLIPELQLVEQGETPLVSEESQPILQQGQISDQTDANVLSEDSDDDLELVGFYRGFWKFRDYVGRMLSK